MLVAARFTLPPTIIILIGINFLLNSAQAYVSALYKPAPETDAEVRERIWHRLWGWYGLLSKNYLVVSDTKLQSSNHWSTWLGGPASLIIYDGFAVYLERGNCFSRVVATSTIIDMDPRETMKAIREPLHPEIRTGRVNAWTKDGIRIKIKMRVEFQIEPGVSESPLDDKLVYPLNRITVHLKRSNIPLSGPKMEDKQESDWCDGTMGAVAGVMGRHICGRRMDELFTSNGGGVQMLSPIVIKGMINSANTSLTRDAGFGLHQLADHGDQNPSRRAPAAGGCVGSYRKG